MKKSNLIKNNSNETLNPLVSERRMMVDENFLKELGFLKSYRSHAENEVFSSSGKYYSLRIHTLTWLFYDTVDGFMEIRRKIGGRPRKTKARQMAIIILPKPFREKKKLKALLKVLT